MATKKTPRKKAAKKRKAPAGEFKVGGTIREVQKPAAARPSPARASDGSLARKKAALVDEVRDLDTSAQRRAECYAELARMGETPILSRVELDRLED